MLESCLDNPALFIIPHFAKDGDTTSKKFIAEAVEGLFCQSDKNWKACIIDDNSTNDNVISYLEDLSSEYPEKFKVIFLKQNFGPGVARNIGVIIAEKNGNPFILFNDADDISHPDRLRITRNTFKEYPEAGLVYSAFEVVDENNVLRPISEIPSSIMEIYELYQNEEQLEGEDVWIDMGTRTGYMNKTSATSVLTSLAIECPFPNSRASEDYNVWMRISAKGAYYKYVSGIPTRYRIPKCLKYQNSRSSLGNDQFNKTKVIMDTAGFEHSIDIALSRKKINVNDTNILRKKFYLRLAKSMNHEGEVELENMLLKKANEYGIISQIQSGVLHE